jgi:hypothetical protein
MAIMAITNRIWKRPPALYPINPNSQAIIRIAAMTYNKFPIIVLFNMNAHCMRKLFIVRSASESDEVYRRQP